MTSSEILDTLLKERGIDDKRREEFLNPDYARLHDPLLLPNMDKARDRMIKAMKDGEHIVIYSDYDADGIPGAVVLSDFFKRAKYGNVSFYIPHRHDEGFGLNCEAIDVAKERGATLLMTIDCGVADVEEVEYANSQGIEVIITDHHLEGAVLPPAYAIVNPNLKKSEYPFKDLCGAAVAWKLVQAILQKESFGIKEGMEKWSLDMVGIATLSDMVPLVGENRILAKFGLEVLKKSPRPGLASLFRNLKMDQAHLTEDDIAFMITPRINAASRMGKPMDAFNLLATIDMLEAMKLADHLETINQERKTAVATLVKEAKKHVSERETVSPVIVIGNPEWRPSLMGLVANSLVEEYGRPAFVWGRDGDGILKGSCRTVKGIDLHTLMSAASDIFIAFGGHSGAGGFSVSLENVALLEEKLSQALADLARGEGEEIKELLEVALHEINEDLWRAIATLAPFGTGNPKPIFVLSDAEIRSVKQFGKTGDHLELVLASPKGRSMKAISFFSNADSFDTPVSAGSKATIHANLEKSYFRNRPELRLRIVDIKP